jgi:hypothetical protein
MKFPSSFVLLTSLALASGCASAVAPPAQSAAPQKRPQTVELRHIYLLSPGPNSTLVVTQSDMGASTQERQ